MYLLRNFFVYILQSKTACLNNLEMVTLGQYDVSVRQFCVSVRQASRYHKTVIALVQHSCDDAVGYSEKKTNIVLLHILF